MRGEREARSWSNESCNTIYDAQRRKTPSTEEESSKRGKIEEENKSDKIVYLAKKLDRPVPLTHYSFITTNSGIFKAIKDKSVHEEIKKISASVNGELVEIEQMGHLAPLEDPQRLIEEIGEWIRSDSVKSRKSA